MANNPSIPTSVCPSASVIHAYARGADIREFAGLDVSELETHLLDCPTCATLIDQLDDPSDALIQTLTALPCSAEDEQAYHDARANALQLRFDSELAAEVTRLLRRPSRLAEPDIGPLPFTLGNYELLSCIGRGASGAVYRARHLKLDQRVAVKVLDAQRAAAIDSFLQELKTIGKLDHPHIIRATDAGEVEGVHFLVMEYVAGIDAARLLFRHGPLPVAEACEVARQTAVGLDFVHQHRLVHRDIKPSNLLVTSEGQVKLLDLGIATQVLASPADTAAESRPQGTADYMPPEQWTSPESVDARTDLYSLGCTLLKLLTGQLTAQPIQQLDSLASHIPRSAVRLLRHLLAPEPADRPASAAEVMQELSALAKHADLQALVAHYLPQRESTRPKQLTKKSLLPRRQLLAATSLAAGSALLLSWRPWARAPQLRKSEWRELEPLKPEFWLTTGNSDQTRIEPLDDARLQILAGDMALVHLGRPVTSAFRISIGFAEPQSESWGIFFHGRDEFSDSGRQVTFQTLEVSPTPGSDGSSKTYQLLWSDWTARQSGDQVTSAQQPLAETQVEVPSLKAEHSLELVCGIQGMPQVYFDGQLIPHANWNFASEARSLQQRSSRQLATAYLGRLGLFNRQGSTTFSRLRLAYL